MPSDRSDRLAEHARARHQQTLRRAQAALADMVQDGEPITISHLAGKASVSRAWIYTQPDLRTQVEQLQQRTRRSVSSDSVDSVSVSRATTESLKRRLALAHETLAQLRAENQQLRQDLARVHGQLREAKTQAAPPPEVIQAPA